MYQCRSLRFFRWAYQAKVMKIFDPMSSKVGSQDNGHFSASSNRDKRERDSRQYRFSAESSPLHCTKCYNVAKWESSIHLGVAAPDERALSIAPSSNGKKRCAALQLRFDLLQFGEEEFLASDFTTIFETNQIGFSRRAGDAGDFIDEVAGGFYLGIVGFLLGAKKADRGRRLISRSIADEFRIFKIAQLLNQCLDFLLFRRGRALCTDAKLGRIAANDCHAG